MFFNFNNQEVKQVTFNGNAVNFINLNGARVWANIPGVPAPSHSSVTASSVVISWAAVDRANSYTILLGAAEYTTSNTQITIDTLSHNTSFNYQVRANGDGGSSEYSVAKSFKTTQVALATPSVSASTITSSSVTLSWSAISNATQYYIEFEGEAPVTVTGTSKTFSGLSQNTSFSWQVRAEDTSGSGASKYASSSYASGNVTTTQVALATPSVSVSKTTSSVTLSWSAISNATQYYIEFEGEAPVTVTGTSTTFSSLFHNTNYDWKVRAEDTLGSGSDKYANSSYASGNVTTTQATLATPSPSATSTTVAVTVTWSQITNAEGYIVKFAGTNYTVSGGSTTSKTFSSLIPNTSYAYQVQATDSGGSGSGKYINSAFSTAKSINTQKLSGSVQMTLTTSRPVNISYGYNATTIPQYVDIVSAVCVGGGGGAGGSGTDLGYTSGLSSGGGGGGGLSYGSVPVTNNDLNYIFQIGSGGVGTRSNGGSGGQSNVYFVKQIGNTVLRSGDYSAYDVYVDFYQDLINYYNANIASSGTSKYSWGSSHWASNGRNEGRWLPGNVFLRAYGGTGGKLASPSLGTYQSSTNGTGGGFSNTASTTIGYMGGPGGLASRNYAGGGGGGAAGYAGNGGGGGYGNVNAQYTSSPNVPASGSGAGAGGSASTTYCFGGGGVGLFGNTGTPTSAASGGSSGGNGTLSGFGGSYGGGGGSDDDDTNRSGGSGAQGGIRLVWGPSSRHYPNSNA